MDERLAGQWSAGLASPVHWSQVTFILGKHLQMTKDPGFADNVLFILLER